MERLWAVIKFPSEDDAVAAVPTSWLNGNNCYWPPWSKEKVSKAIKNCTPPETTWQSHPFLPLRNNVFNSYETAIKKSKKATKNSDLESQSESNTKMGEDSLKRRKIVKTKLTRFASFEVMENSSDGANETSPHRSHNLPEPPYMNDVSNEKTSRDENIGVSFITELENIYGGTKRKCLEKTVSDSPFHSLSQASQGDDNDGTMSPSSELEVIFGDKKRKRVNLSNVQSLSQGDVNFGASTSAEMENITGVKKGKSIVKRSIAASNESSDDPANSRADGVNTIELKTIAEYLRKIVRKQNIIQCTLTDVAEDVTEIKKYIKTRNIDLHDDRHSIFISLKLPVETQTEMDELETFLNNDEQLKNAVREVSSSGGKDIYDLIYRATGKLVTNGFASNYSYYGRNKEKAKFSSLKLNKLLIDSAVKTFSCTEKEAELAISKWLRRCAERAKNERKSQNV